LVFKSVRRSQSTHGSKYFGTKTKTNGEKVIKKKKKKKTRGI